MQEFVFRAIERAITSIADCTDKTVVHGAVRLCLTSQCSPYASHRGVTFERVEGRTLPDWIVGFANSKYALFILSTLCDIDLNAEWLQTAMNVDGIFCLYQADLPIDFLAPLLRMPGLTPNMMATAYESRSRGFARVLIPIPRVERWDDGKPVFAQPKPAEPTPEPRYSLAAIRAAKPCAERYKAFCQALPELPHGLLEACEEGKHKLAWTLAEIAAITCQSDADWVKEHVTPEARNATA